MTREDWSDIANGRDEELNMPSKRMGKRPLSRAERELDEAMYNRLKPTPGKPEWAIQADFELHTEGEILASLRRLELAGRVTRNRDKANGWRTWTAVTEEADCVACEIASITYSDYGRVHTCRGTKG